MADNNNIYETVIGLEVHAQLMTRTKLFCGDSIAYGAEPNTHISPITLAHPGTLPKMNSKAVEFAVKMGLACGCEIEEVNYFARKNYFYPDLPKGYQISQHTTPICKGGSVKISVDGRERHVRLNRIHMEEDAGKSIHDADPQSTCVDYNRAGTALIEIVTEPDLHSGEEVFAYLSELRKLLRYLEVCDGNMEEGSMRCDVNISVKRKTDTTLGTKVEIKNLNSMRNAKRAVETESIRLMELLSRGESVTQQTRGFDVNTGKTFAIRDKEDADDYRYFADPDLTPFHLGKDFIQKIQQQIPALPNERIADYMQRLSLSEYDARVLSEEKEFSDYFESLVKQSTNYKAAANWMLGPVKTWLNDTGKEINEFPLQPGQIARLISLLDEGKISFSIASSRLFPLLLENPGADPLELASANQWIQESDTDELAPIIEAVLLKFSDKVLEYKKGKKGLLSLFVGEVMKQTKGKADPKVTNAMLVEKLKA